MKLRLRQPAALPPIDRLTRCVWAENAPLERTIPALLRCTADLTGAVGVDLLAPGSSAGDEVLYGWGHSRPQDADYTEVIDIWAEGAAIGRLRIASRLRLDPSSRAIAQSAGDHIVLAFEIARRREAEARLRYLERHDPVTGAANLRLVTETIELGLAADGCDQGASRAPAGALLWIEVQWIGPHEVDAPDPDRIAIELVSRLTGIVGDRDRIGRVKTDTFTAWFPRLVEAGDARQWAVRLATALSLRIEAAGEFWAVPIIGIALCQQPHRCDAANLLREAEAAARAARSLEAPRIATYCAESHRKQLQQRQLERDLRSAIQERRLVLHYQPEYDLVSGLAVGAEALLRWPQEGARLLDAGAFIPLAERTGLILPLGGWVLQQACVDAARWPSMPENLLLLRINVSARQLEQPGFVEDVTTALLHSGLPAQRLCLEITETALMRDPAKAVPVLFKLRDIGIQLAIDDFGTGYSSLTYLKKFPVDTLKIDRSFVTGLPEDRFDAAIIDAIVAFARTGNMAIVAEGVETIAQQEALRNAGVHRVQGFLYSRAVPQAQLISQFARPLPRQAA